MGIVKAKVARYRGAWERVGAAEAYFVVTLPLGFAAGVVATVFRQCRVNVDACRR